MKIFVCGGTTGIGWEIAKLYLDKKHKVGICGRDLSKVELSVSCPDLKMYELDIYNKQALQHAITNFAPEGLDILIVSAGSYTDNSLHSIGFKESSDMLKVNIAGAVNALEIAKENMYQRERGHIVVIASVSGLLNYPGATIYSKTKRALIQIAEAYRSALADFGIQVSIVAPGYVNTQKLRDLNKQDLSKKPFVVNSQYAAQIIVEGIEKNKKMIIFPTKMKYLIQFLSILPKSVLTFVMHQKAKWNTK